MDTLLLYIVKFSVSLSVLYLFYRFLLRSLTFYQWNRVFLLLSIAVSAVFPFIDISFIFYEGSEGPQRLLTSVPAVNDITFYKPVDNPTVDVQMIGAVIIFAGTLVLFSRLIIQFISLALIRKNSSLVHRRTGVSIYEPKKPIAPFSFGKSIYINRSMYSDHELDQIIEHELVHIKQCHTADMVFSEILCAFNWYNPFAWQMRRAVRQNLEFIADEIVLQKGFDVKGYQYTLLRASGLSPLPLTNTFSMPNLKKRIVMMNKIKTSTAQLLKFTAVLPVLLFISLMFRDNKPLAQAAVYPMSIESEGGVEIKGDFADPKPMLIIDGLLQPSSFDMKLIKPEHIKKLHVWKGQEAIKKFGKKAVNGVLEIHTSLPLYVLDGVVQMKTSNADQLIKTENIKSMNVLKDKSAAQKYGDTGGNGVIEIVTK